MMQLFFVYTPHLRVPFIHQFMPIQEIRSSQDDSWFPTSDSKEVGCTVIAEVFTRSHPEPGSQALLRRFRYCGTRVHGKFRHCASLLSPDLLINIPATAFSGILAVLVHLFFGQVRPFFR
jgi:hypothetical protein